MFFLIDKVEKIIFGWSAKCGCSHIKNIFYFLQTNNEINHIHTDRDKLDLPTDIENYTTIIFIRNPYKRIISGFLDKYKACGQFRHYWTSPHLTFKLFVDELIQNNWKKIDEHHFTPQTTEAFDKRIFLSKTIKFYDITSIDYGYIEDLYKKQIPSSVLQKKEGHERQTQITNIKSLKEYVYDKNIDTYIDYDIEVKYFYNKEIQAKIFNFYKADFTLFKENHFDYNI